MGGGGGGRGGSISFKFLTLMLFCCFFATSWHISAIRRTDLPCGLRLSQPLLVARGGGPRPQRVNAKDSPPMRWVERLKE